MRIIGKTTLAAALLVSSAVTARAHAQLQNANPRVGSVVRAAPPVLTLNFSEAVEPALSSVQVTDAAGRRVDAGRMRLDKGNSQQVQVPLRALPAGQYNVRWRVISVDTHKTEGSFGFEVRP